MRARIKRAEQGELQMANPPRFTLWVPGVPIGQAKTAAVGYIDPKTGKARARSYRPDNAASFKAAIMHAWDDLTTKTLTNGPVSLVIDMRFPLTKSASKRNPPKWKISKPDMDNIEKAVMDALIGLAYLDDSQVCDKHSCKTYAQEGEEVGTRIVIEGLT